MSPARWSEFLVGAAERIATYLLGISLLMVPKL